VCRAQLSSLLLWCFLSSKDRSCLRLLRRGACGGRSSLRLREWRCCPGKWVVWWDVKSIDCENVIIGLCFEKIYYILVAITHALRYKLQSNIQTIRITRSFYFILSPLKLIGANHCLHTSGGVHFFFDLQCCWENENGSGFSSYTQGYLWNGELPIFVLRLEYQCFCLILARGLVRLYPTTVISFFMHFDVVWQCNQLKIWCRDNWVQGPVAELGFLLRICRTKNFHIQTGKKFLAIW